MNAANELGCLATPAGVAAFTNKLKAYTIIDSNAVNQILNVFIK